MNIFDYDIPKTGENFTTLLEHKNIKINRIVSSNDIKPKVYIQDEDEWLVIIEGGATIKIFDTLKIINKGGVLFVPSGAEHEIINVTNGTIWLTVHIY